MDRSGGGGSSSTGGSGIASRQLKRTKLSSSSMSTTSSTAGTSGRQHFSNKDKDRGDKEKESEPKLSVHKEKSPEDEEKIPEVDGKQVYEAINAYEYEEAKNLDHEEALETMLALLTDVEDNAMETLAIRYGMEDTNPEEKEALHVETMTALVTLKNLNRLMKIRLKIAKDEQQTVREEVDEEHLLLQNLIYEATHLHDQVASLKEYKGEDEKIDLISIDQFYEEAPAPAKVSKPDATKDDPHLQRIARLEYEFHQRQNLTKECASLEKEKVTIGKDIEEKQQKLDCVQPLLHKIIDSTLPLQEFFDPEFTTKKKRHEIAKYLPTPLYVLLMQSEAHQEYTAGKQNFKINIGGDVEAAKIWKPEEEKDEEESDSEDKHGDPDPDTEVTDRRPGRKGGSHAPDDDRKKVLQKHPLWIEWVVTGKGGESIAIQFYHLVKLNIVTVKSRIRTRRDTTDGTSSTSIAGNSDNVLSELFPNDIGLESPNPKNAYLLRKYGISSLRDHMKETGKPYDWAQKVCGLDFSKDIGNKTAGEAEVGMKASMDISCDCIDDIFRQIRKRLTNQGKLWTQLRALESHNIQIPSAARERLPLVTSTLFTHWGAIDFEEYCGYPYTKPLVERNVVTVKDMFFKAVLQRSTAKMIALIAIKPDYPAVPPVFCVLLDMHGRFHDAITYTEIRQLEQEINYYAPLEFGEFADSLVNIQLYRLMTCCDIILETNPMVGESAGPSEFSRGKLILLPSKGRNLRRPFKYVSQGGGHYTQRY